VSITKEELMKVVEGAILGARLVQGFNCSKSDAPRFVIRDLRRRQGDQDIFVTSVRAEYDAKVAAIKLEQIAEAVLKCLGEHSSEGHLRVVEEDRLAS
jgi:hypothetical protein